MSTSASQHRADDTVVAIRAPVARCGRCRRDLGHLPPEARYCPRCGAVRPAASAAENSPALLAAPHAAPPAHGPRGGGNAGRSPIVVGYGNALLRLGWRYETGAYRNVFEALRCYRKAAHLGNIAAAARLNEGRSRGGAG